MITRHRNPRGEECSFSKDTHSYWIGTDRDNTSQGLGVMVPVTKLIEQFYLVSPWKDTEQDFAFDAKVHSVAASCLNGLRTTVSPKDDEERAHFSAVWKFAKRLHDNNESIGVEKVLFAEGVGVAGTMDFAFWCNCKVHVCDWKTGNILLPAKCKFNAPFAHLVADPMTIYSLQCSMFQLLIEIGCYVVNATFAPARLLWVHKEDGKPKIDAVACRDLRREAAMMIAMRMYTPWWCEFSKSAPF